MAGLYMSLIEENYSLKAAVLLEREKCAAEKARRIVAEARVASLEHQLYGATNINRSFKQYMDHDDHSVQSARSRSASRDSSSERATNNSNESVNHSDRSVQSAVSHSVSRDCSSERTASESSFQDGSRTSPTQDNYVNKVQGEIHNFGNKCGYRAPSAPVAYTIDSDGRDFSPEPTMHQKSTRKVLIERSRARVNHIKKVSEGRAVTAARKEDVCARVLNGEMDAATAVGAFIPQEQDGEFSTRRMAHETKQRFQKMGGLKHVEDHREKEAHANLKRISAHLYSEAIREPKRAPRDRY